MPPSHQLTLNLHGLGEAPSYVPDDEARYWLPVDFFVEVLDLVSQRTEVRLTFDDGNATDFEVALPELAKRNMRAEFFVLAGRIGQPGYLTPAQIRELLASGMGIGLHGMEHRPWAGCDSAELDVEIDQARRQIEAVAGRPITRAACPFGAYDARCLRRLRDAGFERVYTSDGGVVRRGDWLQCRNTLQNTHRVQDVRALVDSPPTGLANWRRRMKTFVKSKRGGLVS